MGQQGFTHGSRRGHVAPPGDSVQETCAERRRHAEGASWKPTGGALSSSQVHKDRWPDALDTRVEEMLELTGTCTWLAVQVSIGGRAQQALTIPLTEG